MAPHPVKGADGAQWELLALHKAGEGPPCPDGHPTEQVRIYCGVWRDDGTAGVARVDLTMCATQLATFMERYNR